jgi:hypothetical protein
MLSLVTRNEGRSLAVSATIDKSIRPTGNKKAAQWRLLLGGPYFYSSCVPQHSDWVSALLNIQYRLLLFLSARPVIRNSRWGASLVIFVVESCRCRWKLFLLSSA